MSAILSDDKRFRFVLTRRVDELATGQVCWVMYNPSTADDSEDDPTIRRVIDFTRRWGYRSLVVVNLLPIRATNPEEAQRWARNTPEDEVQMWAANRCYVEAAMRSSNRVVAAWGVNGTKYSGASITAPFHHHVPLWALGVTVNGQPKHPLHVAKDANLVRWEPPL